MPRMLGAPTRSGLGFKALFYNGVGFSITPTPVHMYVLYSAGANSLPEFSWRQMAIPSPEEAWRNIRRSLPVPQVVRRFIPGFRAIKGAEMKRAWRRKPLARRVARYMHRRHAVRGVARRRVPVRRFSARRRLGLVPNHRRRAIWRRHAHNIVRAVRARQRPPRKRVELNVVDWKQTRVSTVKGGDTVGSLYFTDIGPANDDTLSCECVPVELTAGAGPAGYVAIGTARNRRRGREIFAHREFLKLRFLVNDAEGAISDLPNGVCRIRLMMLHVYGDRQRTFLKDAIPLTEVFKDFTNFGINSPYHSKRDVLVNDDGNRLNYKVIIDKVYTLRPSMAGAPQDEHHTFNVMLPARTLSWYPGETTAADCPRYGGRIVFAIMQEGGRVIQTQVAGGALPAEQACYKNIDPSVLAGAHRWKLEMIGRRYWSDPS